MKKKENNFAFIDSQNLNLGTSNDILRHNKRVYRGWKLDMRKFRVYLKEKYKINKAFLFVGYVPGNESMYAFFQQAGYICVFKPTLEIPDGDTKGNVDAELVLHSMIQFPNYDKAVIVSGDGDFYCLIEYLINNNKLKKVLVPNKYCYSGLLKKLATEKNQIIDFVNNLKNKLRYNEKGSRRDKTLREPFSS